MDGLEIVTEISYKELYGKLLDLCNVDSSLHKLEMRFLLPGDAMFAKPIQITLDKHVHWYVGLNKKGQPCPIFITRMSKGPALVNDKTNAVEPGELELEIETETWSFNNVQLQENDYWQDSEILPENDVRLQANDNNEVDENVDDYRDGMDINADDQNVKSPARNSKNTVSNYSSGPEVWAFEAIPRTTYLFHAHIQETRLLRMCLWNSRLTPESRDIAEVLDDLKLHVQCTLYASPEEKEEEYVRLFISGLIREDPILDAYLHEDRADGTARDEEPDDIFEQVREDDPLCSLVAQDEHEAGQSSSAAAPRAPLWRSRPCCEHENILRQILEQIKYLPKYIQIHENTL
ncbi:hypothetical protein Fot_11070 [Forsythia ovata]|uniref:Uncharacterized protein n=1 Tax=Forsythia ovata TaxID=205694 RepID=A0ABD1WIM6_9LAMI